MFHVVFLNSVLIFNFKNVKINLVGKNLISLNSNLTITLKVYSIYSVEKPSFNQIVKFKAVAKENLKLWPVKEWVEFRETDYVAGSLNVGEKKKNLYSSGVFHSTLRH